VHCVHRGCPEPVLSDGSRISDFSPAPALNCNNTSTCTHTHNLLAIANMTSTARRNKGKGRAQEDEKVIAALPLGKQLAHTGTLVFQVLNLPNFYAWTGMLISEDKAVRDRAVRSLVAFVSRGGGIPSAGDDIALEEQPEAESSSYVRLDEAEMAKLWKGLFYCELKSRQPAAKGRRLTGRFLDVGQTSCTTVASAGPILPPALHPAYCTTDSLRVRAE
jgi:hypothetical protein